MFENLNELENNKKIKKYISVQGNVNIIVEANNSADETCECFGEKLNEYTGRCDGNSLPIELEKSNINT